MFTYGKFGIAALAALGGAEAFLTSTPTLSSSKGARAAASRQQLRMAQLPLQQVTGQSSMATDVLDRYMSLDTGDQVQAEYVWLDAEQRARSKCRTLSKERAAGPAEKYPKWTYDGSSTEQAPGDDSEVIIVPRAKYRDPFRGGDHVIILCDTYDPEGNPLPTNTRAAAAERFEKDESAKPWYGLEQEYTLFNLDGVTPLGWPVGGFPGAQGPYYCGAGADRSYGRAVSEAHYRASLYAGLQISGTNAEVMPGQWEYQIGPAVGIEAADQLTISRYLLNRVCEDLGVIANIQPKPIKGPWNGAGMHINFSTEDTRKEGGLDVIKAMCEELGKKHDEHIAAYGEGNADRLTGDCETADINTFSYGIADRGCSIRIPRDTAAEGMGYLEDRRPASNVDPYVATSLIFETTSKATAKK
uniref:Glutamine synthetase n=1 Tax=Hemiselmis andersenii TaxID=464988 RepID=A0A6U2AVR2_HEMAN